MKRNLPLVFILISILIRLIYSGSICLLPEEAYYWKYAMHPDLSYLDHPPVVALSINGGIALLGMSEFGVRFAAMVWWCVTMFFVYLLSVRIYDRYSATGACMLFAVLPYFFGAGFFITPDSPLIAFWAGALYFLYRVLIDGDDISWWGAGLCLGLGMLSKYPIALVGFTAVVYLIITPSRRSQLLRIRPYSAAFAAFLLFSPVLIWNYDNQWASFAFQSADRISKPFEFSLHMLLVHVLAVLTPAGIIAGAAFLLPLHSAWFRHLRAQLLPERELDRRFMLVFTLIPLCVFAFFSLTHEVKVNWTGPVFLSLLPVLGRSVSVLRKTWLWTAALLLIFYAVFLQYISSGFPHVPYPRGAYKFFTGNEIASRVMEIERKVADSSGNSPVVVGMDKHYLASQLGFYRAKLSGGQAEETAGRSLFGLPSLMYHFWSRPGDFVGRNMLLISKTAGDIDSSLLAPHFKSIGSVEEIINTKNGFMVGRLYYRVGYSYIP